MMMALPTGSEWLVPLLGLGYAALGVRWLIRKVQDANLAQKEKEKGIADEAANLSRQGRADAVEWARTTSEVVAEKERIITTLREELRECRESGARVAHSYFELQGRMDEVERRVIELEHKRTRKS